MAEGDAYVAVEDPAQAAGAGRVGFDEEFDLVVSLDRIGETSTTTRIAMQRADELAAEVEVRHVVVDPDTRRKAAIPEAVKTTLGGYAD